MNPNWLFLIVPIAMIVGAFLMLIALALASSNKRAELDERIIELENKLSEK